MKYDFICDSEDGCDEIKVKNRSILEGPPKKVMCSKCGKQMRYDITGGKSIQIKEHMKAGNDEISPTEIGNRMNRSRPSGKRKVFF